MPAAVCVHAAAASPYVVPEQEIPVSGWHNKSMMVGAAGDDFGGVAGSELGLDGGVGSSLWAMVCGLWSLGGGVACGGCGRLGDAGGLSLGGAGALGAFWNQGRVERP